MLLFKLLPIVKSLWNAGYLIYEWDDNIEVIKVSISYGPDLVIEWMIKFVSASADNSFILIEPTCPLAIRFYSELKILINEEQ